jgi:hypothetical protein
MRQSLISCIAILSSAILQAGADYRIDDSNTTLGYTGNWAFWDGTPANNIYGQSAYNKT